MQVLESVHHLQWMSNKSTCCKWIIAKVMWENSTQDISPITNTEQLGKVRGKLNLTCETKWCHYQPDKQACHKLYPGCLMPVQIRYWCYRASVRAAASLPPGANWWILKGRNPVRDFPRLSSVPWVCFRALIRFVERQKGTQPIKTCSNYSQNVKKMHKETDFICH